MRCFKSLFLIVFTMVMLFAASAANASYQRFMPSGIDSVSPRKAAAQVLAYADLNDDYAKTLAEETRAFTFNPKDYVSRGYSKARGDTSNSATTGDGSVHASSGGVGTKTLVLMNRRTGYTVAIMVRCGNPRLGGKCHCKPVRIEKGKGIRINKKFKKVVTRTCPSGQRVTVPVSGRVTGFVRGTVTARVLGDARIYFHQQVRIKIKVRVQIKCGKAPKPRTVERVVERVVERPVPTPVPTPSGSAECEGLFADNSLTANRTVDAVLFYRTDNVTLENIEYNWGDGLLDNTTATKVSHTYATAGSYVVYATLRFAKVDGSRITATCAWITVTPKDGTSGQGTGTPGSGGGSGSGGDDTGDPDNGDVCRDPRTGNIRTGRSDQLGYCTSAT